MISSKTLGLSQSAIPRQLELIKMSLDAKAARDGSFLLSFHSPAIIGRKQSGLPMLVVVAVELEAAVLDVQLKP